MRLIAVLSILFFLNMQACHAQLTSLGTVNVSGESVSITTIDNSNLLVTNSLLQFNEENQPEANLVNSFLPDEIRLYPNPVNNILDINILHANKGKHQIELLDAIGLKIKEQQLNYNSDNSDLQFDNFQKHSQQKRLRIVRILSLKKEQRVKIRYQRQ